MIRDGLFVNDSGRRFVIHNGSMYSGKPGGDFPKLTPGYYDTKLKPISEQKLEPLSRAYIKTREGT